MTFATRALTAAVALTGLATPTPVPEPAAATGPGIAGFLVTFALVLACIPLFLSMTRKVRGVRFRDSDSDGDGQPGLGAGDSTGGVAGPTRP